MTCITEDAIEQTALEWMGNLGYEIANGLKAVKKIVSCLAGQQMVGGDV